MKDRTLPQPVGRRILVLIIALFIASVVWLMLQGPDTPEPSGNGNSAPVPTRPDDWSALRQGYGPARAMLWRAGLLKPALRWS